MKISTSELHATLWQRRRQLFFRLSFEERSAVIGASAPSDTGGVAFASEECSDKAQTQIRSVLDSHLNFKKVDLRISDPLGTANTIYNEIIAAAESGSLDDSIIDITTFRREELLMLLHILRTLPPNVRRNCDLVYVGAGDMSGPLSGKVVSTRSVVGFAGVIWPSRPTRLVVLMGFEIPRARAIIESYEPKHLIIGRGRLSESINETLWRKNEQFFQELQSNYSNLEPNFEFSPRDPLEALAQLEKEVPISDKVNTVIAPLNTKLSTIGAGLFAQNHPEVQLCYAEVGSYNEESYSTVGTDAYIFSLSKLFGENS